MQTHADQEHSNAARSEPQGANATFQFADQRAAAASQNRLSSQAASSPQAAQLQAIQALADASPGVETTQRLGAEQTATAQRQAAEEEEPLQGKFALVQRAVEDEEAVQGKFATVQRAAAEEDKLQMKGAIPINGDTGLEREADAMGEKSVQVARESALHDKGCHCSNCTSATEIVQPKFGQGEASVQRICGTPGCTDPDCHDPSKHGFSSVRTLRNVNIYNSDVSRSQLGEGSGTSKQTRDYVQDPSAFYPRQVELSYRDESGTVANRTQYTQPPLALGEKPDAGHIKGRQYGGSGKDTASVFSQQKSYNRGNSYQGTPTFGQWRKTENEIRSHAEKGTKLQVQVKLRKNLEKALLEKSITKEEYEEFLRKLAIEDVSESQDSDFTPSDSEDDDDDVDMGTGESSITV